MGTECPSAIPLRPWGRPGPCLPPSGHLTCTGPGQAASSKPLLLPSTAVRVPGPRATFTHTHTHTHTAMELPLVSSSGFQEKGDLFYLPVKRTWPLLLPGAESPRGEAPGPRDAVGRPGGLLQAESRMGRRPSVIGRGLQAIWRPHLQTCLAWVSRPLALGGHTKMVFMVRP